ncbi:hypothetical protein WJX72_006391 [[Myrmecia] bisecta]|uniref:nitrile hydratase n=1 Tax=[Myrmecia] bisecta TaxID=41462 RepID=A0AAW1PW08_9CHLO
MFARTGVHDLGGVPDDAPLDLAEPPVAFWHRQTHALLTMLSRKGLITVDELRRATEGLPEAAYNSMSYYQRWTSSISVICLERGIITQKELDDALGYLDDDQTVKFSKGDIVRVKAENSAVRWRKPHLRTPGYVFGLVGEVERECMGLFADPEAQAFRFDRPKQPLYRVRFAQRDVWEGYTGSPADSVEIEIYQPWLEPATAEDLARQRAAPPATHPHPATAAVTGAEAGLLQHTHSHVHPPSHGRGHHHHDAEGAEPAADHSHSHSHSHRPGESEEAHTHEARTVVEQNAVDAEGDDAERRRLSEALVQVMTSKGIVTAEELRAAMEAMDARGQQQQGAALVAKAWADPAFKARLLEDSAAAAEELGILTSNFPQQKRPPGCGDPPQGPQPKSGTILTVVENTEEVHNLIVCTLCSCYPMSVLGMPPPWYKSRSYRARAVRDPRGVLREFGTEIPAGVAIRVHDSTADLRYIVLPKRPPGTEGWTEQQLKTLVTRDSLIGVAHARTPPPAT